MPRRRTRSTRAKVDMQVSGSDVELDVEEEEPNLDVEDADVVVDDDDADDVSDNREDELDEDDQGEVRPFILFTGMNTKRL